MITGMYPYLVFDGRGQEAVKFYEHALHAAVLGVKTFGDMPPNPNNPLPEEAKGRVLNAHLQVGGLDLMLSDTFPGTPYQLGSQVTIALTFSEADAAKAAFDKLQEDGQVRMPFQATFFSPGYGQLTDQFGITWQISTQPAG
ncbi:VOC family protein [Ectobacillus ponti]|uniref:VOC family protein n=1 Tax=Ectobacillus ponti TaxID=2961894 RepID=A0AA41X399_9BACI|nr:VOC family protein [Ectobacillus ponti]MCP8967927.1 VOC family protein [Ectobacillus ponti]